MKKIYKIKVHLFLSKTTIMVNKYEKNLLYNFCFRQTAILFHYFFNFTPFLLLFSSFFPYLFRFNFVVSEQNVQILFWRHILGGTFSPLLDISERNIFPRWGVHVYPVHPPCVHACQYTLYILNFLLGPEWVRV